MTKDTQRGKKGTSPRSSKKKVDPAPVISPGAPLWDRRAKDLARGILGKGLYDAAAHFVKKGIIYAVAGVAGLGGYHYYGLDYRTWLRWAQPQIETGSITKAPVDAEAVKREVECRVAKAREVDALTSRRKMAWADYKRCEADWKPGWDEKQTMEVVCGPKLKEHKDLAQAVRDREAKDCSPAPAAAK